MKKTPEQIIEILHSITKVSVKDKELDVWFNNDPNMSGLRGYIPGSFTRELLELIEWHMLEDESFDPFSRDLRVNQITEAEAEYLKGEPVPLKILIPVKIEE